jgi:hypothetical protein
VARAGLAPALGRPNPAAVPRPAGSPPPGGCTAPTRDPRWVRPAVLALLAGTAGLYLWGLGASGWANGYYAAVVKAGARSWRAFFFGSLDWSNFITTA